VAYGDYRFTYHGVKWSDNVDSAMASGVDVDKLPQMSIHALVDVTHQGKTYPIRPLLVYDQARMAKYSVPAALPGAPNAVIALNDVQLPSGATLTTSNLPDPMEMVQVDLSTKPMIWLVWAGTILYTIGGLMAYGRRRREHGAAIPSATGAQPEPLPESTTTAEPVGAGARPTR
jgi:hypothetical protein